MLFSVLGIYVIFGILMACYGLIYSPDDATLGELLIGAFILILIWPYIVCEAIYNTLR